MRPIGEDGTRLLDLAFLVFDMLALDGVILLDDHLFGHRAGVLLGHVEVPRARGRVQADLDGGGLCHGCLPCIGETLAPR